MILTIGFEQILGTIQEQFKFNIFPFIETIQIQQNKFEEIREIIYPTKIIIDLIKQVYILENKINYAKQFITKPTKTLASYLLPYLEPSEEYIEFCRIVFKEDRLEYLPIEIMENV